VKSLSEIVSQNHIEGHRSSSGRKSMSSHDPSSGISVGAKRNRDQEEYIVKRNKENEKNREQEIEKRTKKSNKRSKETLKLAQEETNSEKREKIENVGRPNDPKPTQSSKLSKQAQIKTKIIDEDKAMALTTNFGLSASLVAAAKSIMEKKDLKKSSDELEGGTTEVELNPTTDDAVNDGDNDKDSKDDKKKKDKSKKCPKCGESPCVCDSVKEEVEQVDEVLTKSSSAGEWIHDFVKSKNPKFAGKTKEERTKQAIAAYYAKQRNEETEVSETSRFFKQPLKSGKTPQQRMSTALKKSGYDIDKAHADAEKAAIEAKRRHAEIMAKYSTPTEPAA